MLTINELRSKFMRHYRYTYDNDGIQIMSKLIRTKHKTVERQNLMVYVAASRGVAAEAVTSLCKKVKLNLTIKPVRYV